MTMQKSAFPTIKEPNVLDPGEWKKILDTTQQAVYQALKDHGGQDLLDRYMRAAEEIETIRGIPLSHRVLASGFAKKAREMSINVLALRTQIPGFVPVHELEGDVAFLIAEFAEMFFHRGRQALILTPEEALYEKIQIELKERASIHSMEQIVKLFKFACAVFANGATDLAEIAVRAQKKGDGSPFTPLMEQLVTKHVVAVQRLIALKMALRIEALAPEICFKVSSLVEVVPHLGVYAQAREEITQKDLEPTFLLIANTMNQMFNSTTSLIVFYNNIANLAVLIGAYDAARACYLIASRHAGKNVPSEITRGLKLVNELQPHAKA